MSSHPSRAVSRSSAFLPCAWNDYRDTLTSSPRSSLSFDEPSTPKSPESQDLSSTSTRSERFSPSSPLSNSPATPRATSPDYVPPTQPRDTPAPLYRPPARRDPPLGLDKPERRPAGVYVPPHLRRTPLSYARPYRPVPFAFTRDLGQEITSLILSKPSTTSPTPTDPVRIENVRVSGGYKWIDPPPGVTGPTIAVPGAPDVWIGRDRPEIRVRPDRELHGNIEFSDYNAENVPAGYDPLDPVFSALSSPAELDGAQVLTGRNALKKIFAFCVNLPNPNASTPIRPGQARHATSFRLDASLIPGSKLVLLRRWELPSDRRGREPKNCHLSFHEQNTVSLFDGSDRTPGYHRIIRYDFGGVEVMVKVDVSAAIEWEGAFDGVSGTGTDCGSDVADGTSCGQEEEKDEGEDDAMSIDTLSIYPPGGSTAGKRERAPPKVEKLSNGLNILRTDIPHPPQKNLITLKTSQKRHDEPHGLRALSHLDSAFAVVYFGQIPNLYLAHHRDGEFEEEIAEYGLGRGVLGEMEYEYAGAIKRVRNVVKWMWECTVRYGEVGFVGIEGEIRCLRAQDEGTAGKLSEESWRVIRESGICSGGS